MGATESICHWQWEYLGNPTRNMFIKLAWDGDKLISHYAVSPVRVWIQGNDITAALSHDTMTDPKYSRLGIFSKLAESIYAKQRSAGHGFVFGFPNRNSIHGFKKKLNWRQIMPTPVYIRPVNVPRAIFKKLFKKREYWGVSQKKTVANFKIRNETQFGGWVDDLWIRCCNQHRLWVVRDQSYLNWRYAHRPENAYHILSIWCDNIPIGYTVLTFQKKRFGKILFVLDFLVDISFKSVAHKFIHKIMELSEKNNATLVSVLLTPGSKYQKAFLKHYFFSLPERMFPQPLFFGARCFETSLDKIVFEPTAWSISWGDNDVL